MLSSYCTLVLGLAGADLGAAAAPVFHDLDEVIADSIKCAPNNPAGIESIKTRDVAQVTGIVQGMSGGVITVTNGTIAFICVDEDEMS